MHLKMNKNMLKTNINTNIIERQDMSNKISK